MKNEDFPFNASHGDVFEDFDRTENAIASSQKNERVLPGADRADDLIAIDIAERNVEVFKCGFNIWKEICIDGGVDTRGGVDFVVRDRDGRAGGHLEN
jgi:hypothetical protein